MSKAKPVSKNQKFGRLTTTRFLGNGGKGANYWECVCDCGKTHKVKTAYLNNGAIKSCGCAQRDAIREIGTKTKTHGLTKTKEFRTWAGMRERCRNKNNKTYADYGGRGITVCKRWGKFENFLVDMGNAPTQKHTLERKNNDKGYSPSNCKWATWKEQGRNKSNNVNIEYKGETKCLFAWAEDYGIDPKRLWARLDRGWSFEKSVTTPVVLIRRLVEYKGQVKTLTDWCRKYNVPNSTARYKLKQGFTLDEIFNNADV